MLDPCHNSEIVKKATIKSLSSNCALTDPRNVITPFFNDESESIEGGKPIQYAFFYESSPTFRELGSPLCSRTPSPTEEKDSESFVEDCIFDLLELIDDHIIEFQADCAMLRRPYGDLPGSTTKPNPRPDDQNLVPKSAAQRAGSILASRLEAEILELRDRLEYLTPQATRKECHSVSRESVFRAEGANMASESTDTPVISTGFSRFEPEEIRMADFCEVFIGFVGFVYIVASMLYCLVKLFVFLFVLISPFHKFSSSLI
ncbi:hypothetical protein TWF718_006734 [Orbilia javanica]|uniref:Uncharacterized protein n=1 Tax=Orbilia javanica TaxID=47235 RepID=A0AAN8MYW5_9PEZI